MSSRYLIGADVLGASAQASADQAVVIRVRNPRDLVRSQSAFGGALYGLPGGGAVFDNLVYSKMAEQLQQKLGEQGVDADVRVESTPGGPPPESGFGLGLTVGAGAVGALWLVAKLFRRNR